MGSKYGFEGGVKMGEDFYENYDNEARQLANKALQKIHELELKINYLEEKLRTRDAYNEYQLMKKQGDKYRPEYNYNRGMRCDFVEIGDTLICTCCHKSFKNEDFIPPYCPHCLA
jgi:hypothetical protein